jgi:dTDP-4-dehydrorhamnose 3,5-epimerase-like enzyme
MTADIIPGSCHSDTRGSLFYNNSFDATAIKRFYVIENRDVQFIRAWQGHRLEQRWFSAAAGRFEIRLIEVDDWDNPAKDLVAHTFILTDEKLDVLHVPAGYISSIQSLTDKAKLLVMADYLMGEIKDEYRFDPDYFAS